MASDDFRALVQWAGGWEGFDIERWTTEEELAPDAFGVPAKRLVIALTPAADAVKRCSRCGNPVEAIHDVTVRRVRDLPLMGRDVWLVFPHARLQCPRCGPMSQQLPWLDRYQRMTKRLAETLARFAQVLPLTDVAALFHVTWDVVKQIDQRALLARLGARDAGLDTVRRLAIDEFALHRGQRYATVVLDVERRRVLWVGAGNRVETLDAFFALLGPAGCARLEAVVMDMSHAFRRAVRQRCPHAQIVFDRFHVMAKYGVDVIDRVRTDETNRLARAGAKHDLQTQAVRRVIKGTRWLLLRNRATLRSAAERVRLEEVLAANHALFTVYVLKEDLQTLWHERDPQVAAAAWEAWRARAEASGLRPVIRFAAFLAQRIEGVLAHCTYPLRTSVLEGINNKIKVLKRRAYGYRDDAYFFLKIRAAFPGIP